MPEHSLIKYFQYSHLPPHLQAISAPFSELAHEMDSTLPNGDEKDFALRKLLESKDCAVRSFLSKPKDDIDE